MFLRVSPITGLETFSIGLGHGPFTEILALFNFFFGFAGIAE